MLKLDKIFTAAKLESSSLADQACEALDAAILNGKLPPGARISEAELASQFGISRGPLREAISRLEGRGLIRRVPHTGVRVVELNDDSIREVFLLREVLEGLACKLAAENRRPADMAHWRELISSQKALARGEHVEIEKWRTADWNFHWSIIQVGCNQRLAAMLCNDVYYQLRLYKYRPIEVLSHMKDAIKGHDEILNALVKGDGAAAEGAMRRHIALACRSLVKMKPAAKKASQRSIAVSTIFKS